MVWLERLGYRINLQRLAIAILFLAIPSYVFLAVVIEGARTVSGSFWGIRGWAETVVAVAGAAGIGYLGFSLWLMGY